MEHPIPQNVTSFQFKLVGDMTLKQFLYLCIGIGVAYLVFITLLSSYPIIAWPIIILSATTGAAFAFLPIADRPLDYWVVAFFKAVYSPTKRSWTKGGKNFSYYANFPNRFSAVANQYKAAVQTEQKSSNITIQTPITPIQSAPSQITQLNTSPVQPTTQNIPQSQPQHIPTAMQASTPMPTAVNPVSAQTSPQTTPQPMQSTVQSEHLPTQEELAKTVELAKQAQALQVKIIETERQLNQIKTQASTAAQPEQYTQEVNQMIDNLQKMVQEASTIKQALAKTTHQPNITNTEVPPVPKVNVVVAPKPQIKQLVLTTFPNVINGVVTDAYNNYLDAVVVVIYDREGLPVRALKTNKLGQFSGATPLPNGTYTIQLEKDSLVFDVLQVQLDGKVLPPLLITAKGGQS